MAFLDIQTRWIAGFGVGAHRNRALAIYCLDQLQNNLACLDRRLSDILIHHDRDSVYTSYDWLHRVLIEERAGISFAMNGAKDNPWIESFWGRFKTEKQDFDYARRLFDRTYLCDWATNDVLQSRPTAFCLELSYATRSGAGHSYEKYHD